MALKYRIIQDSDNPALAEVIKKSLEDQGNNKPGTIYCDPQLYQMSSGYKEKGTIYYVVYDGDELLGGCGIAKIPNQQENYCELQRMFLKKESRGKDKIGTSRNKSTNLKTAIPSILFLAKVVTIKMMIGATSAYCKANNTAIVKPK